LTNSYEDQFAACDGDKARHGLYRRLSKTLHPDGGGDPETFRGMMAAYKSSVACLDFIPDPKEIPCKVFWSGEWWLVKEKRFSFLIISKFRHNGGLDPKELTHRIRTTEVEDTAVGPKFAFRIVPRIPSKRAERARRPSKS